MNKIDDLFELNNISKSIRIDIIKSLAEAGSGHLGGSLGLADVFTVLYFNILNHKPNQPEWKDRDRLVLSIGHVAPVLYSALANAGYFSKDELLTLRKLGSRLQGHPGKNHLLPGIEVSSGSLGQGLSVAVGMALSAKSDDKKWRIYSIHGDGEIQEGSIWEAAMSAAHYKLDNITALIDRNGLQIDGSTTDVMNLEPLDKKWEAFGWNVIICDGNDIGDLVSSFRRAIEFKGKPTVIIANTIMGKGVKAIENNNLWHGKVPSKYDIDSFISQVLGSEK
jgi:transketolase